MNYLTEGINCIAVNENKQAIFPWKKYQSEMITKEEFDRQMSDSKARGMAIICGAVSGNLEVIDIDTKYETYDIWKCIQEKIPAHIYTKLHIVKTKNNGLHLYYRSETIEGNQKLAQRYPTKEEIEKNPQIKSYCIIETRGEAGYVVAPPTQGYQVLQEGINVITFEERDELISIMRSFNEVIEEKIIESHHKPSSKEYGVSPFEDYNRRGDICTLLQNHGWKVVGENSERIWFLRPGGESKHSGSFNKEMNLFSVFSSNTPFEVNKGYRPVAVFAILECGGDFKLTARKLFDLGFGEKKTSSDNKIHIEIAKRKREGATHDELSSFLVKKYDKSIKEAEHLVNISTQSKTLLTFWDQNDKGTPSINRYRLRNFLTEDGGFMLYFYEPNSTIYRLIRERDGFVEESSTEQIKKFIKDYLDRIDGEFDDGLCSQDILELIYKGSNVLFSDNYFEFFNHANIDFLKDEKDCAYFPFKNGVVVVTKDDISLKTYGELKKCVWKTQVIDYHIIIDQDIDTDKIEYFQFIKRICGDDGERILYALSLIGYLLHQYKDPARPFAVILAEETDNEEKGGGTGKGIFVKALSYIIKTIRVDGKNFALDKNFAFQRVDLDTRLIAIEDTRKKVDFEGFYSIITEGITVEKKNKDELFIPYKDSPKIMFTTNYTIPQTGVHAKRRQKVLEFAPYFGQTRTPEDEFGHKLFDDWDKDEWGRFYNLLFFALQDYLRNGVSTLPMSDKIRRKALKNQFGEEFNEYFDEILKHKDWVTIDFLHQDFLTQYGMDKKDYSRKRYMAALKCGMELLNIDFEEKKDSSQGGKKAIKCGKASENVDF